MAVELTDTMRQALCTAQATGGKLYRYPGGFWGRPDVKTGRAIGTPTVRALVARGLLEFSEWRRGRGQKWPIEAQLTDQAQTWFEETVQGLGEAHANV